MSAVIIRGLNEMQGYTEVYICFSEVEWYQPCVFDILVVDTILFAMFY